MATSKTPLIKSGNDCMSNVCGLVVVRQSKNCAYFGLFKHSCAGNVVPAWVKTVFFHQPNHIICPTLYTIFLIIFSLLLNNFYTFYTALIIRITGLFNILLLKLAVGIYFREIINSNNFMVHKNQFKGVIL